MKRAVATVASIQKRLPPGMSLPAKFAGFVELVVSGQGGDAMNVVWSNACPLLNADDAALDSFVPFLLLSDGGVVALWVDGAALRVAYCDSEGQSGVLAEDFSGFLAALAQAETALLDQLELDAPLDTSQLTPTRKPEPVSGLVQRTFTEWVESHSLSAPETRSPAGEAVRSALHAIAARMLQDGLSKVYKRTANRWTFILRVTQRARWTVEYLDYGEWHPLRANYGVAELLPALLTLMKTPLPSYELTIHHDGYVFGDRGNQLILVPPNA